MLFSRVLFGARRGRDIWQDLKPVSQLEPVPGYLPAVFSRGVLFETESLAAPRAPQPGRGCGWETVKDPAGQPPPELPEPSTAGSDPASGKGRREEPAGRAGLQSDAGARRTAGRRCRVVIPGCWRKVSGLRERFAGQPVPACSLLLLCDAVPEPRGCPFYLGTIF